MTRPWVTLNMASSIDGKITTPSRDSFSLGSEEDRALMEWLRCEHDAVLVGAGTVRDEDPPLLLRDPALASRRRALRGAEHPVNVVASASLDLTIAGTRFFECPDTQRVVLTTEAAPAARRREAEARARVHVLPSAADGRIDLHAAMQALAAEGVERLLLEGGGVLNFAMLTAGLIDQIRLTLCPLIIGGADTRTSFEGAGFERAEIARLRLESSRVNVHGEVFLCYGVAAGGMPPAAAGPAEFPRAAG